MTPDTDIAPPFRRVIAGYDLRDGGRDAVALARRLAGFSGAELIVAGVFPFGPLSHGFDLPWRDHEPDVAREIETAATAAGGEAEAYPSSSPARGLHDLADECEADLVVVGSSHHGHLGQVLIGNVGTQLLHGAPCAVAVAPAGYRTRERPGLKTIAVGYDATDEAELALGLAATLSVQTGARLRVYRVAQAPPPGNGIEATTVGWTELVEAGRRAARKELDAALAALDGRVEASGAVLDGPPAEQLAGAAAGADLLVLGSRGHGPLRRVLLGSVSAELVRGAPCPVLVMPRMADAPIGGAGRLLEAVSAH
jgi:nucleotide-binding universal stress UspA family protein